MRLNHRNELSPVKTFFSHDCMYAVYKIRFFSLTLASKSDVISDENPFKYVQRKKAFDAKTSNIKTI